ncbi:hypothetical protein Bbelb_063410 [Branchiostoma belcheri]|nr:hypothetical protein Bbelb_063410 [Branchiostoma belcheri]
MESNSWEDKLTCTWRSEGQLDITGFPEDMPMCLQYYLSSIKAEKWPRALNLIQEGEGHCFLSGTGISFPRDYESSSSDEEGPRRGPLPEDEVEFFAGRFPKNRLKRLLFLRTVMKCLSKRPKESLSSKSFLKGKTVEVPQSEPMELEETKPQKTDVHAGQASHVDIQDLITNNYDLLKENINAMKVIHHMIHKRVLERSDQDKIYRQSILKSGVSEALLDMLSRRRSCPPALFLDILRIEHPDIVERLSTEVSSPKAIISRQKDDAGPFYRMTHKPRGTALIFIDADANTSAMKEDSARDDDKDCYLSQSSSPNYTRTLAKTLIEYGSSEDFVSMMSKVYSACDDFYCRNGLRKRLYFPP